MNLDYAKNKIIENVGIKHHFLFKGSRNQIDEFYGKIVKCFPSVFIIELENGVIRSFSYNDFIINNLKIVS